MSKYSLTELNQMNREEFVDALGEVFEDTPAIAQKVWEQKPFTDLSQLHQKMVNIVENFSPDRQLKLIRAHPDLGSKAKMAPASVNEQAGVGLDRLDLAEYDRFQLLNQAYKNKFGFPFILAVKDRDKDSILEEFERRLGNSLLAEKQQALKEIFTIAWFRLKAMIRE
ncbi:2-oxo-4-hydroxy-4-carboxy-5-ureidoimidazoline decarboxylase [Oscillatoria salina]|uniref:2-oxo-4-hydroxy-4-carboxy-5-ureidoimidazoline decarboxylase n=1 Tax=Oscillatoria salina TaxID=331517 RepID=UPI0013BAE614|nr:2-oxo-4-hydroxy-4-carboxy-5-ureidoimidazoline decarboxylase [Oscillatoria salina]MBZ8178873.1 2-oxo-4-hydroxy-4-carboxy-5-ureidoimidazoline decarboxylase [Oscillatoria salina IIICB1]NET86701.1 2-oxo-4-hydroxy-4-carboxy-5-ureidoimidazoline decarboxylase [Kamptonema sp. SIO1D9]